MEKRGEAAHGHVIVDEELIVLAEVVSEEGNKIRVGHGADGFDFFSELFFRDGDVP